MEPDRGVYSPIVGRPPLRWPDGCRVALWVCPNIEHYEYTRAWRYRGIVRAAFEQSARAAPDVGHHQGPDAVEAVGGEVGTLLGHAPAEGAVTMSGCILHVDDDEDGAPEIDRPLADEGLDVVGRVDRPGGHEAVSPCPASPPPANRAGGSKSPALRSSPPSPG
jgi:hypothetical protein